MKLELPDELVRGFTEAELRLELGAFLHAQSKASAESGAKIAGINLDDFLRSRAEHPYSFENEN